MKGKGESDRQIYYWYIRGVRSCIQSPHTHTSTRSVSRPGVVMKFCFFANTFIYGEVHPKPIGNDTFFFWLAFFFNSLAHFYSCTFCFKNCFKKSFLSKILIHVSLLSTDYRANNFYKELVKLYKWFYTIRYVSL